MALTYTQKSWTFIVLVVSIFHLLRDIMQFLSWQNIFTSIVVRSTPIHSTSLFWHPLNTVIIEIVMLFLCVRILLTRQFGWAGNITVFGALCTALGFVYYWFVL